jgi:hypothetical protein
MQNHPEPMFQEISGELDFTAMSREPARNVFNALRDASPLARDIHRVVAARAVQGLGQPAATDAALSTVSLFAGLAIRGVAGYFAGKAMAPRGHESKYAWGAAAAAAIFGTVGLGVTGAIALSNR